MNILSRWFLSRHCSVTYAVLSVLAACVACDRKDEPDGGGGGTVPNASRLGWTQSATSLQQVQSMMFRLYVNGTAMSLSGVSCVQGATAASYDCAGRLPSLSPGRHVLELTSILNDVESLPSGPLTVTLNGLTEALLPAPEETDGDKSVPPPSGVVCLTKTARCDGYSTIAFGLADVIGLSALSDGRLLFIEGGRHVRVIENGRLLPEPALTVPAEATLAGLAVDRAFDQTRFVFVAWAEVNNNGEHRLNITRYRELAGTLGEGARIVTHLPFRPEARAPLAVDDASFLYVAVPSQQELFRSAGQAALPTGSVLKFTRDGLSAGSSRASPLIAYGYPRPTSLVVDAANGDLWLAGMEADQSAQFSRVDLDRKSTGRVPTVRSPESINHRVSAPSRFEPTLTIVRSAGGGQQPLVVVGADGQLLQGMISAEGKIDGLVPLATGQAVPLYAAAQTPDGSLYVVAGETGQTFVLRLTEW